MCSVIVCNWRDYRFCGYSVVVRTVHIVGILAVKPEGDPVVLVHPHRPVAFRPARQPVQPVQPVAGSRVRPSSPGRWPHPGGSGSAVSCRCGAVAVLNCHPFRNRAAAPCAGIRVSWGLCHGCFKLKGNTDCNMQRYRLKRCTLQRKFPQLLSEPYVLPITRFIFEP